MAGITFFSGFVDNDTNVVKVINNLAPLTPLSILPGKNTKESLNIDDSSQPTEDLIVDDVRRHFFTNADEASCSKACLMAKVRNI